MFEMFLPRARQHRRAEKPHRASCWKVVLTVWFLLNTADVFLVGDRKDSQVSLSLLANL